WVVAPIHLSHDYAISLSQQQLVAIVMVVVLTWLNTRGLKLAKTIQNVFTSAKTLALFALIVVGVLLGRNATAIQANFSDLWTPQNAGLIQPGLAFLPAVGISSGLLGAVVAFGVSQVGSLFSSDAWNNITFTAAEVKDPKRTIPLAMAAGT